MEDDLFDEPPPYWDYEGIHPAYTPTAPASSFSVYDQQQQQQQQQREPGEQGASRSLETLELILQKMLRSLGALADNFDRFVSSFEAKEEESLSAWWSRVLKSAGSGMWSQIPHQGFRFDPRSPLLLWACSILVIVLSFVLLGIRMSLQQSKLPIHESPEVVMLPPKRIQLRDGRNISYREEGVAADQARHSILIVHGFLSSRLAGIPGINSSLLQEFGIRIVAYDLPGFGDSDVHHSRDYNTSTSDMVDIADALGLGDQFWLLAYSGGGPHAWAAIRYIPDRLAGVAMIAPAGNPYKDCEEAANAWRIWSYRRRLLHFTAKRLPSLLRGFIRRTLMNKIARLKTSLYATVGEKDQKLFEQQEFLALWEENLQESMKQQKAVPLAKELLLLVDDWGFDLEDLKLKRPPVEGFMNRLRIIFSQEQVELLGFQKPIHIWQGTEDFLVPLPMNELVKRVLPQINLHKLEGEGHFSWFFLCQECHRNLIETMFGEPQGPLLKEFENQAAESVDEEARIQNATQ